MPPYKNLKFIKNISWNDAFGSWARDEAHLEHWIEHYKKRGFNSWQEWRKSFVESLHPQELDWGLYEITEPFKSIMNFHGGPFKSWIQKYYGGKVMPNFGELAQNIAIQNDDNINEIIQKFPKESTLIGIIKDKNIIIIEGMHRCCALAIAYNRDLNIDTKLSIILAEFSGELPSLS